MAQHIKKDNGKNKIMKFLFCKGLSLKIFLTWKLEGRKKAKAKKPEREVKPVISKGTLWADVV